MTKGYPNQPLEASNVLLFRTGSIKLKLPSGHIEGEPHLFRHRVPFPERSALSSTDVKSEIKCPCNVGIVPRLDGKRQIRLQLQNNDGDAMGSVLTSLTHDVWRGGGELQDGSVCKVFVEQHETLSPDPQNIRKTLIQVCNQS